MIEVKLNFATIDDALEAIGKLAGITTAGVSIDDAPAKKKATPAQKNAAATNDGFDEPAAKAPAKGKKAAKKAVPSVDELKAHIMEHAGEGPEQPAAIKEYVRSFGVAKISDMTEAQRQDAFDGAEEYFGAETEEDPMD